MAKMLFLGACYAAMGFAFVVDAFTPQSAHKITSKATISSTALNLRVAYQGEPGAYSEKSTRELLGDNVIAIGKPNFDFFQLWKK